MDNNKAKEPGLNTLAEGLEKRVDLESRVTAKLFRDAHGKRERAQYLLSGKAEKEKDKTEAEKGKFIINLALNGGDSQKGYKSTISLSAGDLAKMHELGINIFYQSDTMADDMSLASHSIPFILPDGQTGMLFIHFDPKKSKFIYRFIRNVPR